MVCFPETKKIPNGSGNAKEIAMTKKVGFCTNSDFVLGSGGWLLVRVSGFVACSTPRNVSVSFCAELFSSLSEGAEQRTRTRRKGLRGDK